MVELPGSGQRQQVVPSNRLVGAFGGYAGSIKSAPDGASPPPQFDSADRVPIDEELISGSAYTSVPRAQDFHHADVVHETFQPPWLEGGSTDGGAEECVDDDARPAPRHRPFGGRGPVMGVTQKCKAKDSEAPGRLSLLEPISHGKRIADLFQANKELGEKIDTILHYVREGSCGIQEINLRNVVVVGCTGSGKSTLINGLAGCKFAQLSREEATRRNARLDAIRVLPINEGGTREAVAKIGDDSLKSETLVYSAILLDDKKLVLWDAPGFKETRGPEVSIANAVNLCRLLRGNRVEGTVFVVVLDSDSVMTNRGAIVTETVYLLRDMFEDDR